MDALITFLRARLDEDEQAAKAVPAYLGGPWQAGTKQGYCGDDYAITAASGQDVVGPGLEGGGAWGTEARDHIARHESCPRAGRRRRQAADHRPVARRRQPRLAQGLRRRDLGRAASPRSSLCWSPRLPRGLEAVTIYKVDHAGGGYGLLTVETTCDLDLMKQFLEAHDIDVNAFPCPGYIDVKDGSVTFEVCVKDENGRDVLNAAGDGVQHKQVTVEQRAPWPLDRDTP